VCEFLHCGDNFFFGKMFKICQTFKNKKNWKKEKKTMLVINEYILNQ
jgi:hypothetical protein